MPEDGKKNTFVSTYTIWRGKKQNTEFIVLPDSLMIYLCKTQMSFKIVINKTIIC
jgi:hypothetical protein